MSKSLVNASLVGLGAALVFFFDRERGRRRRSLIADRSRHALKKSKDNLRVVAVDAEHRVQGAIAKSKQIVKRRQSVSDETLVQRVRSSVGRDISHPHALNVVACEGHVTLSGAVLEDEVKALVRHVKRVPGVREVENNLEVHSAEDGVPGMQGKSRREGLSFVREQWTPLSRAAGIAAGTALLGASSLRGRLVGVIGGLAGLSLVARAVANQSLRRILALDGGRDAVTVQKTFTLATDIESAFEFFRDVRNFPRFMRNVIEVSADEDGNSQWTVQGPLGRPVQWTAELSGLEENKLIAWRSLRGEVIANTGTIRFDPVEYGTRVDITFSYSPPLGILGHAGARALGVDPKRALDEDMSRVKSYFDTGRPARDAAAS